MWVSGIWVKMMLSLDSAFASWYSREESELVVTPKVRTTSFIIVWYGSE